MPRYRLLTLLCAAWLIITVGSLHAQERDEPALHIDIPTTLEKANGLGRCSGQGVALVQQP
jgi:hypothetical protein